METKSETKEETIEVNVIETALIKSNITESALKEMEESFMLLKVNGVNDKEGLKKVHDARIMVRNTRLLTVDVCKKGREKSIQEQKDWISKEKYIVGRLSPVESYLKEQEDVIENEKKREKEEKEKAEQERIQNRTTLLIQKKMEFNGSTYSMGELAITPLQVKLMDDFSFNTFFAKVEAEYQKVAEIEAEKERLRLIEEERLKKVAEEQRLQAEDLKKRENELKAREEAAKKTAEENEKKVEAERKLLAEQKLAAEESRVKERSATLFALGLGFTGEAYTLSDNVELVCIPRKDLVELSQNHWDKLLASATEIVTKEKERLEKEKADKIEADKKAAVLKAQAETEAKIKAEEESKLAAIHQEELRIQRENALKPDREKLLKLIVELQAIKIPELTTEEGKIMLPEITQQFEKFAQYLQAKTNKLK